MPHVSRIVDGPDGQRYLVDRRILAFTSGYTVATIRKHLTPCEYDQATGVALYDQGAAVAELERLDVEPRPGSRGPRPGRLNTSRVAP